MESIGFFKHLHQIFKKIGFLLYILRYEKVFKEKQQQIIKNFSFRGTEYVKNIQKEGKPLVALPRGCWALFFCMKLIKKEVFYFFLTH